LSIIITKFQIVCFKEVAIPVFHEQEQVIWS